MFVENAALRPNKLSKERKKEFLQQLTCTKTSDDKVAVMLSFLKKKEIPLDTEKIYRSFYKLKEKYPKVFEEFVFSRNDVYPFSSLLSRILFRLQNAGIISTVNPDFKRCIISDESKTYIQKNILPIFQPREQEKLKEIAKMFEQLMFE